MVARYEPAFAGSRPLAPSLGRTQSRAIAGAAGAAVLCLGGHAWADDPPQPPETFAIHGQSTFIQQGHPAFTSPYQGPNSMTPAASGRQTFNITLYVGAAPWQGAEFWIDPEVDQGFGLSNTLGAAGFPNGQGSKVGSPTPYVRIQRLFWRQTFDLGGATETVDPDENQLGGTRTADRVVLTLGKFSVTDVFDVNPFAHDPARDFLNWTLMDAGSFDFAADAWGYTAGGALEWYQGGWTVRGGLFALSDVPNGANIDWGFGQFQMDGEIERRFSLVGEPGSIKLTGFMSRGRMGLFKDAIALSEFTHEPANASLVRRYLGRGGLSLNLQQQASASVGLFLRAGFADGDVEPYEFTDVDRTVSGGVSVAGKSWGRPRDTFALGGAANAITAIHQQYLNAGGLGILVGDGKLPHPGDEEILETYYSAAVLKRANITFDYQLIVNPAYNRDRGPISVFALRLHGQF